MITLLIFILCIVVLILVHEFGHFIVAKLFGIRVEEFSIFFGPKLLQRRFGDTLLSLRSLPFGGYVRIFGEDASAEGDTTECTFDKKNFSHRSRLVQAAVIVAGIAFNFIFAWLALSSAYMVGMQTSVDHIGVGQVQHAQVTILDVLPDSPAARAGIKANDVVESIQTGSARIDTQTLDTSKRADAVQQFIIDHQNESMVVVLDRAGKQVNLLAKPADGVVAGHKALGIELDDVGLLRLSPPLALVEGAVLMWNMTSATATGLAALIGSALHGTASLNGVAGPIGIARIGAGAVAEGFIQTIIIVSLISINLGIVNILPIPGLDGGRLLFIIIEGIIRRPIPEKFATRITIASFALICLLALVISYHDIITWNTPV